MTDRTAPVELVQAAVTFGLRTSLDVNEILASAGFSPMLLAEGRSRVTEGQVVRIVQELWRSTDDEMFGLGAHPLPRGSFRMLCFGLLSAGTLGAALERLAGFAGAMPALPPIESRTDATTCRVLITALPRQDPEGVLASIGLVIVHRFIGWAIGRPLPLQSLELPGSDTLSSETLRLLFGIEAHLHSPIAAISFDRKLLAAPIIRNEAELEAFVASSPAGLLTRPESDKSVADQVRRILEIELDAGSTPTAEIVARRLSMSTQTLRRRLTEEGTSPREIRDDLLRDVAVTSLVRGEESVADLSTRLGFSEPSAFTRAFRRWTGSTPGAYRRDSAVDRPT